MIGLRSDSSLDSLAKLAAVGRAVEDIAKLRMPVYQAVELRLKGGVLGHAIVLATGVEVSNERGLGDFRLRSGIQIANYYYFVLQFGIADNER